MLRSTFPSVSFSFQTPITSVDKWIKNVYSLRIGTGIKSGELHTATAHSKQFTHSPVHNTWFIPLLMQVFTPQLSPRKIDSFNPLYRHLYPQSTAPINKKKKGKKERNT